jgi:hypothetical protein
MHYREYLTVISFQAEKSPRGISHMTSHARFYEFSGVINLVTTMGTGHLGSPDDDCDNESEMKRNVDGFCSSAPSAGASWKAASPFRPFRADLIPPLLPASGLRRFPVGSATGNCAPLETNLGTSSGAGLLRRLRRRMDFARPSDDGTESVSGCCDV